LDVPVGLILLTLERSFASTVAPGAVSHVNYAKVVYTVPLNLLAAPIQTVMFSKFAQQAALGNQTELRDQLEKTLRLTILLILPMMALLIFFRQEIVSLLFERGSFTGPDTVRTSALLIYFGMSMLAIGIWWLLRQVAYAIGDMISPLLAGLAGLIIYILGNWLFLDRMGASALALNWAVSFYLSDLLLGGVLIHRLGGSLNRRMIFFSFKTGLAACLALLFLLITAKANADAHRSSWSMASYLLKYGPASMMIYVLSAWILGIEELKEMAAMAGEKIRSFISGQ
jgi:putative peptidoglycan lipid II flippase